MKRLLPICLALLAGACGPKPNPPLQGYVEGEYVRVAAPFAGTLVTLDVRRGQQVASGAALFALEAENEDAARREAEERARRAEALVEDLRKGRRASEIESVHAQLAQADWRLRQRTVASTVSGTVIDTLFVQGEWVPAGNAVVSLLPPTNVKVRFFVPQPQLGAVKLGQKVEVACDACGAPIAAQVSFIAPQAEYTPPVIYSQENRAKLVFLVEARPAEADAAKLHPGQPVDVRLP